MKNYRRNGRPSRNQADQFLRPPASVTGKPDRQNGARMKPPHYFCIAELGRGSTGVVYRARQLPSQQEVAIKVLDLPDPPSFTASGKFPPETGLRGWLLHPHITRILDVFAESGGLCIVMELVRGINLTQLTGLLGAAHPFFIRQVCLEGGAALQALHQAGYMHGMIKCSNFMITDEMHIKLMDSGIDTLIRTTPAKPGRTAADPESLSHMSPEQLLGEPLDHRSDIFSFGLVLYHLATGINPVLECSPSELQTAITSRPFDPAADAPGLPAPVCGLIRHCLEKRREDRFQSMTDIIASARELPESPPPGFSIVDLRYQLASIQDLEARHSCTSRPRSGRSATGLRTAGSTPAGPTSGFRPWRLLRAKTGRRRPVVLLSLSGQTLGIRPSWPFHRWLWALAILLLLTGAVITSGRTGWLDSVFRPAASPPPVMVLYYPENLAAWIEDCLQAPEARSAFPFHLQLKPETFRQTWQRLERKENKPFFWIPLLIDFLPPASPAIRERMKTGPVLAQSELLFLFWKSKYDMLFKPDPASLFSRLAGFPDSGTGQEEPGGKASPATRPVILTSSIDTERESAGDLPRILLSAEFFQDGEIGPGRLRDPLFDAWSKQAGRYFQSRSENWHRLAAGLLASGPGSADGILAAENTAVFYAGELSRRWEPVMVYYPRYTLALSATLLLIRPPEPERAGQEPLEMYFQQLSDFFLSLENQKKALQAGLRPVNRHFQENPALLDAFYQPLAPYGIRRVPSNMLIHCSDGGQVR